MVSIPIPPHNFWFYLEVEPPDFDLKMFPDDCWDGVPSAV